jgi:hypothetical protein
MPVDFVLVIAVIAQRRELLRERLVWEAMWETDADLLDEYDFSSGVRGKYAAAYTAGSTVVVLDPDVARLFPTPAVNEALQLLAREQAGGPPS